MQTLPALQFRRDAPKPWVPYLQEDIRAASEKICGRCTYGVDRSTEVDAVWTQNRVIQKEQSKWECVAELSLGLIRPKVVH